MHIRFYKFYEVMNSVARFYMTTLSVNIQSNRVMTDTLQKHYLGDNFFSQNLVNFS